MHCSHLLHYFPSMTSWWHSLMQLTHYVLFSWGWGNGDNLPLACRKFLQKLLLSLFLKINNVMLIKYPRACVRVSVSSHHLPIMEDIWK